MVGFGYDSHAFEKNLPLILGGIKIESEFGPRAHSDGDAVIHALVDSILGAMGKGDIGELYPDNDPQYKGADSTEFLRESVEMMVFENLRIINIDITIVLEKPKLSAYKDIIRKNIANICQCSESQVNIKAKTNEKMGFVGRGEGIAVFSICQLEKN